MKFSLGLLLALTTSNILWSQERKTVRHPASYAIHAPDGQNFSLRQFNLDEFPQYTVNFAIRQREQDRRFADKKQWEKWRTKWTYFLQNFPEGQCAHPVKFIARENDVLQKTKDVCLEKLTPSEREEIKKLVSTFAEFIYGK